MDASVLTLLGILIAVILGFMGIFIMFSQLNQQVNQKFDLLRTEIKEVEIKIEARIEKIETKMEKFETKMETRMEKIETKLDTLLMGLFRNSLPPEQRQQNQG